MGKQTFIEINGKKYDAVTGKLIKNSAQTAAATVITPVQKNVGVVDGFKKPSKPARSSAARKQAQHATKKPQKSKTLMRSSVSKPKPAQKKTVQKTAPGELKKKLGTSTGRQHRATTVARSPHIQKFEHPKSRSSVVKKVAAVEVKKAPVTHHTAPTKPVTASTAQPARPRPAAAEKLIEAALANAEAHNNEPVMHQKRRRKSKLSKRLSMSTKAAAMSSATLAILLLAGFFAVQNVPNFAMRVAATRAGFNASMPGYNPSGFSFKGPINYSNGQVTISFQSNTDDRRYNVTQRSSNWNSDALLANFITAENKQYQTYQDKGRTLYIYDGSSATWVNDGVWYQIEGKSAMTTDQLIRIASSM